MTIAPRGTDAEALAPEVAYATMIDTLRKFLDRVSASSPAPATMRMLTDEMARWTILLGPSSSEDDRDINIRQALPSRGRAMCPPFVADEKTSCTIRGTVVFGCHFLGRNGAAHGGAVAMLFDEVFGTLANQPGEPRARTAHLEVDYLRICPIERPLYVEAKIEIEEGRKRSLLGTIICEGEPCARASALMIRLREGQP